METRLGNSSSRRIWADAYAQLAVFIRINADDYMLAVLCDQGSRNSSYPEPFYTPPCISLVAQFSYNPRSDLYSLTSLQNQKRICLAKTQELATYCSVSVKEIDTIEIQIQMEYAMMIFLSYLLTNAFLCRFVIFSFVEKETTLFF